MPACAACGLNMTVAEVTARPYDGVAGNYHRDCAYAEYLLNSGPAATNPSLKQEIVSTKNKLNKKHLSNGVPTPAAPAGALAVSTNLGIGQYKYAVTFIDEVGETVPGTQLTITTTSGNQAVNLTAIPTGPASTSTIPLTKKRNIYRTVVAGSQLKFLTTLNDNTTTTFNDTVVDGSLGANAPAANTYALADFP
jgi:hypothetical protein